MLQMRHWQANILGAVVAAGVVVGGLLVNAPEAEANGPTNPMRLVPPAVAGHGTGEIPLGEGMELWGQPSRLNLFWTSDSADEVIRTYSDAWKAAGFEPKTTKQDRVSSVSMVEKASGLMRTITVIDTQDQRMVIPGLTDVRIAPELTPRHAPVPVPETARSYMAHVDDDGSSVSYSGSYLIPIRPAEVAEFYRVEMKKLGYRQNDDAAVKHIKAGEIVEFSRGPEFVQVVATRPDAGRLEEVMRAGKLDKKLDPDGTALVVITHTRGLEDGAQAGSKP
jgi:hypothetical protein